MPEPLLRNSPLLSWIYAVTDVRAASRLIGTGEIVIALLLAARPLGPKVALLGGLGAAEPGAGAEHSPFRAICWMKGRLLEESPWPRN